MDASFTKMSSHNKCEKLIFKNIQTMMKINKMNNCLENNHNFNLEKYFELLENSIQNILSRHENDTLTFDILDTEKSKRNKLIALKEKQRQMKIGEIWQEVLGNYDGCVNLKIGHETGLDILSHTKKIAIELKIEPTLTMHPLKNQISIN